MNGKRPLSNVPAGRPRVEDKFGICVCCGVKGRIGHDIFVIFIVGPVSQINVLIIGKETLLLTAFPWNWDSA